MFKHLVYCSLGIIWIILSFYKPMGILENVGTLFSYHSGIYTLKPQDEDTKKLQFLAPTKYQLEIHLDEHGIPHIYGKNEPSLAFGVGYMHARDRYFQMELMTRKVQGKLAELVGTNGVESDRFWLAYNFEQKAKETMDLLKKEQADVYQDMLAYAEGVNFYIKHEDAQTRPPEYHLLGEEPREWQAHYSILLSGYMSYVLAYDDSHTERHELLQTMPEELRLKLYDYQDDQSFSINPDRRFGINQLKTDSIRPIELPLSASKGVLDMEKVLGSNNWALTAQKSASGNAILCNDTHLDLVLPGPWYEIHVSCPSYQAYGFSLPCAPYVVSGHNDAIAWGMTNAYWDENEQFLLKINPKDSNQYWYEGKWENMRIASHDIAVKGFREVPFTVRHTKLGSVSKSDNKWYAKRWYPALVKNSSFVTFKRLTKAENWSDFLAAMEHYSFPPQNFAYADIGGNAGILSAGKLPLKPGSYQGEVMDGTQAHPIHFVPFENLPQSLNPERGFVSSANQLPALTDYYVNYSFADIFRIKRINEVLTAKERLSTEDMRQLQGDNMDVSSRDLIHLIKNYPEESKAYGTFKDLQDWDGIVRSDKNEAIRFAYLNFFVLTEFDNILLKHYPVKMRPRVSKTYAFLAENATFKFEVKSYKTADLMKKCYRLAHAKMMADFSGDLKKALAGPHRIYDFQHVLRLPGWNVSVPDAGGNMNTPNVHKGTAGPSMRTLIELDPKGIKSKMVIAGGQSGRATNKNYADQLKDWKNVEYHEVQLFKNPAQLKGIQHVIRFN